MPPRAFPYPLKLGIDICYIPRIKSILTHNIGKGEKESRPLSQFLSKVLTWPERQYFWDRFSDHESAYKNINQVSQFLAGRWAAKEACRKACTHMGMSNGLHHILILPVSTPETLASGASSSPPKGLILRHRLHPYLTDREASTKTERLRLVGTGRPFFDVNDVDGQLCEVSIGHDDKWAQAVAIVPRMELGNRERSVKVNGAGPDTEISSDYDIAWFEDDLSGDQSHTVGGVPEAEQVHDSAPRKSHQSVPDNAMGAIIRARMDALEQRKRELAQLGELKNEEERVVRQLKARIRALEEHDKHFDRVEKIHRLENKIAEREERLVRYTNSPKTTLSPTAPSVHHGETPEASISSDSTPSDAAEPVTSQVGEKKQP